MAPVVNVLGRDAFGTGRRRSKLRRRARVELYMRVYGYVCVTRLLKKDGGGIYRHYLLPGFKNGSGASPWF